MGSERRFAWGAAVALVVLGGCRADVLVPGEPEPTNATGEGLESYEPWAPVIRVIDPSTGEEIRNRFVQVSNALYYDSADSLGRARRASLGFGLPAPPAGTTLHPPVSVAIDYASALLGDRFLVDLTPAPGETLVVDLGEARSTVQVDLRTAWPPDAVDVDVTLRHRTAIRGSDGELREFERWYDGQVPVGRPAPFAPASGIEEVVGVDVRWSSEVEGIWRGAHVEDLAPIVDDDFTAFDVTIETETFWVLVERKGRPVRNVPFRVYCSGGDETSGPSFRFEASASRPSNGLLLVETLDPSVSVEVRSSAQLSGLVSRVVAAEVAAGDTLRVEMGPFDLDVEVVDADGFALTSAIVEARPVGRSGWGEAAAGANGRARLAVDRGLYDVAVQRYRFAPDSVRQRVRIDGDTSLRVELP